MSFTVNIVREKDGTYSTNCQNIPGKIGRGKTRKEAIESIKKMLTAHIEKTPVSLYLSGDENRPRVVSDI
ncbi:MAG: type II toxin-antitoxin system HicB family antitoxin [Leptospirales bacterium]